MAPARLKKLMHFADGTSDIGAAIAAQLAGRNAAPVTTAGPPATPWVFPTINPNAAGVRDQFMAPPGYAPVAPVSPGGSAPTAGMPLPYGPAIARQLAAAAAAPGGQPSYAGWMAAPEDRPQIREAHVGDINPNPGSEEGVNVLRAGHWGGGMGIPLQARIAMMTMPAAETAGRSLLDAAETTRQRRSAAALAAAGGDPNSPAFIRERQQIDAEHKLALQQLAFQQFGLMQLMQSGLTNTNPMMGGNYGMGPY